MTNITLDTIVSKEREQVLADKIRAFNEVHSPRWEQNHNEQFVPALLHIWVADIHQNIIGGLVGRTHTLRAWLEVTVVWVDEAHRGQGLGRALMERAEGEAVRRGCRYARLSTSHYQAPAFYRKNGYALYGVLEDCPPGDTVYYFCKTLISEAVANE